MVQAYPALTNSGCDVIEQNPAWADWSVERLFECAAQQALVINIVIYAQISRSFANAAAEDQFLKNAGIKLDPIHGSAAFCAAPERTPHTVRQGAHAWPRCQIFSSVPMHKSKATPC